MLIANVQQVEKGEKSHELYTWFPNSILRSNGNGMSFFYWTLDLCLSTNRGTG